MGEEQRLRQGQELPLGPSGCGEGVPAADRSGTNRLELVHEATGLSSCSSQNFPSHDFVQRAEQRGQAFGEGSSGLHKQDLVIVVVTF